MKETISKYISKRSNDPRENAMLPQQMGADDMFDGALVELRSYDGSVKLILLRVWRKKFGNSKRILLQREVYVVRVHSMGGVGKQLWHWPSATKKRLKMFCTI